VTRRGPWFIPAAVVLVLAAAGLIVGIRLARFEAPPADTIPLGSLDGIS